MSNASHPSAASLDAPIILNLFTLDCIYTQLLHHHCFMNELCVSPKINGPILPFNGFNLRKLLSKTEEREIIKGDDMLRKEDGECTSEKTFNA